MRNAVMIIMSGIELHFVRSSNACSVLLLRMLGSCLDQAMAAGCSMTFRLTMKYTCPAPRNMHPVNTLGIDLCEQVVAGVRCKGKARA